MFLIAGLGNPERKYNNTKHNVGFDAADALAKRYDISVNSLAMKGVYGKGLIEGEKAMILKPLTYMNLSGNAVRAYIDYYNLDPETELIVIYDDKDLPVGQIRVRKSGSAGGHNGMKSIVSCLGTQNFTRIRIGIGQCPEKWDMADYVLSPFSKSDREIIDAMIGEAVNAAVMIIKGDTDRAMERYNRKVKQAEQET